MGKCHTNFVIMFIIKVMAIIRALNLAEIRASSGCFPVSLDTISPARWRPGFR